MNTKPIIVIAGMLCLATATLHAGPRTSANYSIVTDAADSGGRRATSANFTNDGSVGLVAGISTVASPSGTAKAGYIGQLYDTAGFLVSASPSTLNESGARQLDAWQLLDDATFLAVDGGQVTWSVLSGPITSISPGGLATAGIVYQNTAASVRGIYQANPSSFTLTVLNVGLDDFESYAGDLLDDDWQVLHFGLPPNPAAGPLLDPDGDGQDNRFEFTAGLVPTDAASRFVLKIAPVPDPGNPGQFLSGQKNLIFNPLVLTGGRSYTVKFRTDLAPGTWTALTGMPQSDNGSVRTVTDLNATGATKFYHVEITKP